jgi:membrane-associated phospholipid phosphatase
LEAHVPHRHRLGWTLLAFASAAGLVATAVVAGHTGFGIAADGAVRGWLLNTLPEVLRRGLDRIARPIVIVALAPAVCVLAVLSLVRREWRRAVAGVCVPAVATLLSLELRRRDPFGIGGDAFPSNHAAAGLGLLVGLAVLWPRPVSRRWLVALALAAVVVGLGNITWYAHQPSEVLGSALIVVAVAASTFALLGGDSRNLPRRVDVPKHTEGDETRAV